MRAPSGNRPGATLWRPLQNRRFRDLWIANAVSNLGAWIQTMAAAWLMLHLSASAQMVAWVQAAMTFPIFLLVVPAGILADLKDRTTFLLLTHIGMALVAIGMGILTVFDMMSAHFLLVGTALLGCGAALTMPAWQAAVASLVEPADIHSAAALNGISFNLARAAGPALPGLVAQSRGIGILF